MSKTHLITAFLTGMLIITSCKKKTADPETIIIKDNDTYASLSTAAVDSIMGQYAICGGEITSEGSSAITAVGVCWDTKSAPTTLRPHTNEGAGTGSFRSMLYGLKPSTTYFVRAYATNALGTAYGNEVTFKTPAGWSKVSNNNGPYQFIAIHSKGTRLFAASQYNYQVSISDNEGVSWSTFGTSLSYYPTCFATTPSGYLLVGTNGYGVYSSSDNGTTWVASGLNSSGNVRSFFVTGNSIYVCTSYGLFKSVNNGINWTTAGGGMSTGLVNGLTSINSILLAATSNGVYRSTDNGSTWQLSNSGLNTGNLAAYSIITCGSKALVALYNGVYESTDGGSNWTKVNSINITYSPFLLSNGDKGICWSTNDVYLTSNGGATWVANKSGLPSGITAIGTNGSAYFASTYTGEIYKLPIE